MTQGTLASVSSANQQCTVCACKTGGCKFGPRRKAYICCVTQYEIRLSCTGRNQICPCCSHMSKRRRQPSSRPCPTLPACKKARNPPILCGSSPSCRSSIEPSQAHLPIGRRLNRLESTTTASCSGKAVTNWPALWWSEHRPGHSDPQA